MRHNLTNECKAFMRWSRKTSLHAVAACGLILGAGILQSCEKEILTGQPEWLGNSIYERLQEGITVNDGSVKTFDTTLRLIDDLGYKSTLSKTGSKTIFATPDDAYAEWFSKKGITYDQLTLAQKKRLFNNTMINNAYLIELMSNVSGNPPEKGLCMRRQTAASIYDSISSITVAEMPVNPFDDVEKDAWAQLRASNKSVPIYKDDTSAPMIHFLPDFMTMTKITDEDLSVISNGQSNSTNDSWINGKKVISSEQTCKNGYIYVIDGVVDGTKSMAEIINDDPRMTIWSSFINRFSCPYPITGNALKEYQTLFNTSDSIYSLRYFNAGASEDHALLKLPHMETALPATSTLLFDPGWNQYIYDGGKSLNYDAGVMIVPTDEALLEWWNNGEGRSFKDLYGTMDKLPYATLAQLLRVNMKESFIEAVPSRFNTVLDDEQKPLGITTDNIVESIMGCNGVVYLVNEVYSPVKFRSVIAPALMQGGGDGKLAVAYNTINGTYPQTGFTQTEQDEAKDFTSYLNSLESKYDLIIPYNAGAALYTGGNPTRKAFRYIDPCSYGLPQQNLIEFYYEKEMIQASLFKCQVNEDGSISIAPDGKVYTVQPNIISNRLYNLLDNNIIVINDSIVPGQEYFKTKGGAIMRMTQVGSDMHFQGGYQIENGTEVIVNSENTYNQENGHTYCCAPEENNHYLIDVPLTASKSVYQILKEDAAKEGSKSKLFFKLLAEDQTSNSILKAKDGTSTSCAAPSTNFNISLFDSYNYTVYVPTDESIQALIDNGQLPTWDDYNAVTHEDSKVADSIRKSIADIIHSFVRYHIQDRAVCINGTPTNGELYESALLDPETKRYITYSVVANSTDLTVKDASGNSRKVVKDSGLWNRISREYWIKGTPGSNTATIEATSDAVIHQIDGVLFYNEQEQAKPWKRQTPISNN